LEEKIELEAEKKECAYQAIKDLVESMKNDVAQKANIPKGQIVIADIYNVVADTLAEACKKAFGKKFEHCQCQNPGKNISISMDTFILLKTILEDGKISEEYKARIFEQLIKMNPSLKSKVVQDFESGFL